MKKATKVFALMMVAVLLSSQLVYAGRVSDFLSKTMYQKVLYGGVYKKALLPTGRGFKAKVAGKSIGVSRLTRNKEGRKSGEKEIGKKGIEAGAKAIGRGAVSGAELGRRKASFWSKFNLPGFSTGFTLHKITKIERRIEPINNLNK